MRQVARVTVSLMLLAAVTVAEAQVVIPLAQGAPPGSAAQCRVTTAEIWATDMTITPEPDPISAEAVRQNPDVHLSVKNPEVAKRLAAQLDEIASRACQEVGKCPVIDARFVARLSGADGCRREFVASSGFLVDFTNQRFGRIGQGFRDVFTVNLQRNCSSADAVALVMLDLMERGVALAHIEEREFIGPVTWLEFVRKSARLAQRLESDVMPALGGRPILQQFYYVRLGQKSVEGRKGADESTEAIVFPDDCSAVKLKRASERE